MNSLKLAFIAILILPMTAVAKPLPMTEAMAVMDVMHEHIAHSDDFDINIVSEGAYAVTFWKPQHGRPGGTGLLKKRGSDWQLMKMQASPFSSARDFTSLGVPAPQANALMVDLHKTGQ
jgi:hypothetical protein